MVVDLAVENDPDRIVLIADWLVAGSQVNDTQAAHPQADLALCEEAVVIGPAVRHYIAHTPQDAGIDVPVFAELEYSRNSAHVVLLFNLGVESAPRLKKLSRQLRNYELAILPACSRRKEILSLIPHDLPIRNSQRVTDAKQIVCRAIPRNYLQP